MKLGNINSADLVQLLNWYSVVFSEEEEARQLLCAQADQIFGPGLPKPSWCHLYELPAQQHFAAVVLSMGIGNEVKQIAQFSNQIQGMQQVMATVGAEIDNWKPTETEQAELQQSLGSIFAMASSATMSMRSLMTYGCYLNDLVATVRAGGSAGDKALLSALKIDPTVIGCPSAIARISRAVMLDDRSYLNKVRRAMWGKLTVREQKNYQQMRVVLQVLHETGAAKLGQEDLYRLFVEELRLYSRERDTDEGNAANALRQFAYQFFQQKVVSRTAANSLTRESLPRS